MMLKLPSSLGTVRSVRSANAVVHRPAAPTRSLTRRLGGRVVSLCAAVSDGKFQPEPLGLAPASPKTPYGEYLLAMLSMEPQLFRSAIEDQLHRLQHEREEREQKERERAQALTENNDNAELVLYQRMNEVRATEVSATLEDLMYLCILEKFVLLNVEMLPRMDGFVDVAPQNLRQLTEGIHSKEALELVREHLISVMGPTSMQQYSNTMIKMSKFQMVQVYAASIMFGYFLRRVDQRFQLERMMGTLPVSREDAVARLERLFHEAEAQEQAWETSEPGSAATSNPTATSSADDLPEPAMSSSASSSASTSSGSSSSSIVKKEKSALRRYVESFDQATMVETARIVSAEGAALVERQTTALLGDIKKLQAQIQESVGQDATSMDEVMERMAKAVAEDRVETLTMTIATQRRAVLEAVAYGTFLREVEGWVQTEYGLLTPLPAPRLPPGEGGASSSGGDAAGPGGGSGSRGGAYA